jgi:hypothetical protein
MWRRREGSEDERSTGRRSEGRGENEKIEVKRIGGEAIATSLLPRSLSLVGVYVNERTARQRAANENKRKESRMDGHGAGGSSSVGCESSRSCIKNNFVQSIQIESNIRIPFFVIELLRLLLRSVNKEKAILF